LNIPPTFELFERAERRHRFVDVPNPI